MRITSSVWILILLLLLIVFWLEGPLSPNSALLFKAVLVYTGTSVLVLGLVLAFRGYLPAKKRAFGLVLVLAGFALAVYPLVTKTEGLSVGYFEVSTRAMDLTTDSKPGDYRASGVYIDLYLGRGSGGNTAEVTDVKAFGDAMKVKVDADYCGATRDLVPLVKSIRLRHITYRVPDKYPVEVEINPTCGSIPGK